MKELEQKLRQHYKSEADDLLFDDIHFDSRLKQNVLQKMKMSKRNRLEEGIAMFRRKLAYGIAAVAILFVVAASIPMLQNILDSTQAEYPSDSFSGNIIGNAGSELSALITVTLQTIEEAKERFGSSLLVPSYIPEGYQLTEIEASGTEENNMTRVIFTYTFGDQTVTLMQDKKATGLTFELFEPIRVNGVEGYINAAPGMTELIWIADQVQFSIIGPLSKEDAIKMAESLN